MNFFESLSLRSPEIIVQQHIPLKKFTTLRVGGPADYFAEPASEEALCVLLNAAKECQIPVLLMGIFMADSAAGDILIVWKILRYRSSAERIVYMDHPTQAGGVIFEK